MKFKNFRLSERTIRQLKELADVYDESQTNIVRRLIHEAHTREIMMNEKNRQYHEDWMEWIGRAPRPEGGGWNPEYAHGLACDCDVNDSKLGMHHAEDCCRYDNPDEEPVRYK